MSHSELRRELAAFLAAHEAELIEFRRDLHMHPELAHGEVRTTAKIVERLKSVGLEPRILSSGTGLWADIGDPSVPAVALRADIDALALMDEKNVPYASRVPGLCHACGHDVHTTILLGAGIFLADRAARGLLPGRVRLLFQPAEEVVEGALVAMRDGAINDVERLFALHCDPRFEVGTVGLRRGPITGACDKIEVRLSGPGGHTARPHLTADLVYALGKIVTELPAALSRRVDPRSSLSLVWGKMSAGSAMNAIPEVGMAAGTVRCLDEDAWHQAPDLLKALLNSVANAYGVVAELEYIRGVPPAVNDVGCVDILEEAVTEGSGRTPPPRRSRAWAVRTWPGTSSRFLARWPGSAPAVPRRRPTWTSTRPTSTSMRRRSASG